MNRHARPNPLIAPPTIHNSSPPDDRRQDEASARTAVCYGPEAGEVTLGGWRVLAERPCG
ncbi:MAG: hypothetical protein WBP81_26925 [Solirubrobacteraceae bacterium]